MVYTTKISTNNANLKSVKYNNKYIKAHKKYSDYKDNNKSIKAYIFKRLKNIYADLSLKHFKKERGLWKKI